MENNVTTVDEIDLTEYEDRIFHYTEVDFVQRIITSPIHIMQYDNSLPIIQVALMKNGEKYVIPDGATVNIRWSKKDRTFIIKPVLGFNHDKDTVYFEVEYNMVVYYGLHTPIIEVTMPDDKVAGSSYIQIEVDRNPVQQGDVESSTDYPALEEAVRRVEAAVEEAIPAIEAAAEAAAEEVSKANHTFEIGQDGQTVPSDTLMVNGIFYQKL